MIHGGRRTRACRVLTLLLPHVPLDWGCGGSIVTAAANVRVHALAPTPPKFCDHPAQASPTTTSTSAMAGTKDKKRTNGVKRELNATSEPPTKKAKLLDNTDDEGSDSDHGGVSLKVNEEYARKYEHNKKQAEKFRRTRILCRVIYSY